MLVFKIPVRSTNLERIRKWDHHFVFSIGIDSDLIILGNFKSGIWRTKKEDSYCKKIGSGSLTIGLFLTQIFPSNQKRFFFMKTNNKRNINPSKKILLLILNHCRTFLAAPNVRRREQQGQVFTLATGPPHPPTRNFSMKKTLVRGNYSKVTVGDSSLNKNRCLTLHCVKLQLLLDDSRSVLFKKMRVL